MFRKMLVFGLMLVLPLTYASASDLWLHVHVDEDRGNGERVRINLPVSVIEQVIPLIENEHVRGGKVSLPRIDDASIDLQAMWTAIRDAADGEFVRVDSARETVRVAKSKGMMLVRVDGDAEPGGETVRVTLPLAVVDALLRAGEKELDLMAALTELKSFQGDLVTVEENGSRVRIWIDDRQQVASQ